MKHLLTLILLCTNLILQAQSLQVTYNFNNFEGQLKIKNNFAVFNTNSISKIIMYSDLANKKHYLEFGGLPFKNMDKPQLIDHSTPYNWTVTNQTKTILGYKCKKATTLVKRSNVSYTISAWFTDQLKYQIGPKGIFGLPGLILEIQSDKSELNCIATSIIKNKVTNQIKIPNHPIISIQKFTEIIKQKTGVTY